MYDPVMVQPMRDEMTQAGFKELRTAEDVDAISLDRALAVYRDRFADASDFTFVFVGSFEPDMLRPFVEQYLAALPSTGREETPRDFSIGPASSASSAASVIGSPLAHHGFEELLDRGPDRLDRADA